MQTRELTGKERRAIRKMVKTMCANYDSKYGCLLLDSDCYMFGKVYVTGALCKWFRAALLSIAPELTRIFTGAIRKDTKPCLICGKAFAINGRQMYCSDKCAAAGIRKSDAARSRAYRIRHKRHDSAL